MPRKRPPVVDTGADTARRLLAMIAAARPAWQLDAACRGRETSLFFAASGAVRDAVALCTGCPVRVECLEWALSARPDVDAFGVFGGLTAPGRRALRRARDAA